MDIPRFDATASAGDVLGALDEAGCAVIERLVDEDTVAAVIDELGPYLEATPPGGDDFSGRTTRRTGAILARSASSPAMIAHPLVLEVTEGFLWPGKTTYQLHLTQLIAIGPASPEQALHRDQWCFDFFPFPDDVEVELATMWALTDFTAANGATRVVPGSHREGNEALGAPDRVMQAEMPAGSVFIYGGRTVHGGGANTTDEVRLGLNADYVLGWLRQEENQYLSVPPEVARTLPVEIQELMGYRLGAYALGYVDDVRHPRAFLEGTSGASSFGGEGTVDPNIAHLLADADG
jgi:hypothetical protein